MNMEEYKQLSEEEEKQFYKELSEKLERNEDFINAVQKTFDKYISKKCLIELNKWQQLNENMKNEYYGAAEPPVRCDESHLSGLTEPPHLFCY